MSVESAKAFLKRMKTDVAFARRVTGCKHAKARAELVKAEGYDFTNAEVSTLKELEDKELDAVVGGMTRLMCQGERGYECC